MEICQAYLDTNCFLHFKQFDGIDWCGILKSKRVVLAVCPAVLRDLDRKKFSATEAKIRNRARKILSKLEIIEEAGGSIGDKVKLRFVLNEPTIDWSHEGLSPEFSDDRIIATILSENPDIKETIILVTADYGLSLKAKSKGIRCFRLPDDLRLRPTRSPEQKEIDKLRTRVALLEGKMPDLSIRLKSEEHLSDLLRFDLSTIHPKNSREIEEQLTEIRQQMEYPKSDETLFTPIAKNLAGFIAPAKEEIERYENDVDEYILKYRNYLEEEMKYSEFISRTIEISLVLINEGTSPAEGIDISLSFPGGFDLKNAENVPGKPQPPKTPTPPRNYYETLRDIFGNLSGQFKGPYLSKYPILDRYRIGRNELSFIEGPKIIPTDGHEVLYSVSKLKHYQTIELDPVFVIFHRIEDAFPFSIAYTILADNIPEKIEGSLKIIAKPEK